MSLYSSYLRCLNIKKSLSAIPLLARPHDRHPPQIKFNQLHQNSCHNFHSIPQLSGGVSSSLVGASSLFLPPDARNNLLQAGSSVQLQQQRGMKVKDKLHRRCKDCYFVYKSGVLHVKCLTHPRHNARNKIVPAKETWILSAVSCTPKKFW